MDSDTICAFKKEWVIPRMARSTSSSTTFWDEQGQAQLVSGGNLARGIELIEPSMAIIVVRVGLVVSVIQSRPCVSARNAMMRLRVIPCGPIRG